MKFQDIHLRQKDEPRRCANTNEALTTTCPLEGNAHHGYFES